MRLAVRAVLARLRRAPRIVDLDDVSIAGLLDLFEEHVYLGEITADGRYVDLSSGPLMERLIGGAVPDGADPGELWESLIDDDDLAAYAAFNGRLMAGQDAEVRYRLHGLDGVTRAIFDRARPTRRADGTTLVRGIISDVTRREEADIRAAEAADRFRGLLDVVGEHVYVAVAHPDGRIEELFQGPGADRLLGGAEPDPEMVNWERALHPDDRPAYDAFNLALGAGQASDVEYRLVGADGITRWVHDRAATRRRHDGTVEISGIVSDVTERRRLEDELRRSMAVAERLARTDELTGAFNRRHFAELAASTDGTACGLLLLDADHFKHINDRHGHAAGDAVLVELARRLREGLGAGDLLARWGGEEFAVLLHGVADEAVLRERAEAIREAVRAEPIGADGTPILLTVSVGAALRPEGAVALDAWIESADRALYAAKDRGRDRVCLAWEARTGGPRTPASEAETLARALAYATGLRHGRDDRHSDEVAELAGAVARQLGLAGGMVARCRLGGWLHDVGKVAIPHEVLDKPGPLTDDEWAVMRTHPVHSEAIVARVGALRDSAAAARHHHERFDGTGYPDGLAGTAVPIEARVVAAADAFCAMTADRVYARARSTAEALAELRRCAGTHFDPQVVAALCAVAGAPPASGWAEAA